MTSVKQITENKGLRTIVIIVSLIASLSSAIGAYFGVYYGVKANTKEISRIEIKMEALAGGVEIIHKELYSKLGELHDYTLIDSGRTKLINDNVENIKEITREISDIKGDIKVLKDRFDNQ